MAAPPLTGIHHLTAVSADVRGNRAFYEGVLGLRLVKRTVNQDDPGAYHLFYADALGSPGTDITFFEWPLPPERRGAHSVTRTAFRVGDGDVLAAWERRLSAAGVETAPFEGGERPEIRFEDPEGQRLAIVVDGGAGDEPAVWESSLVPAAEQLRGLGPITMTVADLDRTRPTLERLMGMTEERVYDDAGTSVHVFAMAGGGAHAELHVAVDPSQRPARLGAGAVHHVAFRTPDDDAYHAWTERLSEFRIHHSGEVDRFWFRSLYFREPSGVLFEIATDGPGFTVDEDAEHLGETLVLAPFLEPQRAAIAARLTPLG
ncbi:MAG: ring-cleaving dioxygenase [Baekduia sp.]